MTTAEQTQYRFTAEIESIGKPFNGGDGWDIAVNWKLPGSKYNQHIGGRDWTEIEGYSVGQTHDWVLNRGNLKNGKSGQYTSDYFWDWDKAGTSAPPARMPEPDHVGDPRAQEPAERPNAGQNPEEAKWDAINAVKDEKILKGQAFNAAVALMASQNYPRSFQADVLGSIPNQLIELWHEIYWDVLEKGIPPKSWCFIHQTPRRITPGGTYVHEIVIDEQSVFCAEGLGIVDGQGVVLEGE